VFSPDAVLEHWHYLYNGYGSNQGEFTGIIARETAGNSGIQTEALQVSGGNSAAVATASIRVHRVRNAPSAVENRPASISCNVYITY